LHSSTILYLLVVLLCSAHAVLVYVALGSEWLRRVSGAERLVEDVLETDFFDDSGEFVRSPSRVSGASTVPSDAYGAAPVQSGEVT
jgi:hypothetical protein